MGITLVASNNQSLAFDTNFWHWRAIVETVRALRVVSDDCVNAMHDQFVGTVGEADAKKVAQAIRERVLPNLQDSERILLNGEKTTEPDDGTFYRSPSEAHKNYSTNRKVLSEFATFCDSCAGFSVS